MNTEQIDLPQEVDTTIEDLDAVFDKRGIEPESGTTSQSDKNRSLQLEDGTLVKLTTKDAIFDDKNLPNPENVDQRYMVFKFPQGIEYDGIKYHSIRINNYSRTKEDGGKLVIRPGYMIWAFGKNAKGENYRFPFNTSRHSQDEKKCSTANFLLDTIANKVAELSMA